ncbi:cation:proton antiporter [Lacicoccus alkaliphilus]|nr:sodium:proton antiporter [Salinicoccus alkaliphilus]
MDFAMPTLLVVAIFISLGILSQWVARLMKFPAIVIMSIVGLLIGPIFGWTNPETLLGSELFGTVISLAVAIILFEGSSNLNARELRGISIAMRRILTLNALIGWALGTLAMYYIIGFPLSISLVLAGLFIVTGPTVIQPLLKQAKVKRSVDSILRWESIILDPVGPMFALLAFYIFQFAADGFQMTLVMDYIIGFSAAAALGYGGAVLFRVLLMTDILPQNLMTPMQFVFIILIFSISDAILHESGLLAITIFGFVMAQLKNQNLLFKESDHFIDDLSLISVSTVFILITSSLTMEMLQIVISWEVLLFCLVMILIVRPASVLLSTVNTELSVQERLFVSGVAPRGIVALTVAGFFGGLFSEMNTPMAEMIVPVTFALVFITVVVYGFSFKPLAKALDLSSRKPPGVILLGGNLLSIKLARKLQSHNIPVAISDVLASRKYDVEAYGIEKISGSILAESERMFQDMTRFDQCLLLTRSFTFNNLAFNVLSEEFGVKNVNVVAPPKDLPHTTIEDWERNHILCDEDLTYRVLNRYIQENDIIEVPSAERQNLDDDDVILYHISKEKKVTFKSLTSKMKNSNGSVLGVLKGARQYIK